ncbi:hypothetical protein [Devosia sp.]|uniref:hypothetical protein n=1 Tax=Devosia sp. TaxID=1871048 RepID=UPI003BAD04C1
MALVASPDSPPDQADRDRVHTRLRRRNRLVRLLRWVIPALAATALLVIGGALVLDALRNQFGFSNIHIDRNNLVVDTPELHSTTADGTAFSLSAEAAKAAIGSTDVVDLTNVVFSATPAQGPSLKAEAASAELQTSEQLLTVVDTTHFSSSDGMSGTVDGLFANMLKMQAEATGAVHAQFGALGTLDAAGMRFDGNTKIWVFQQARITLNITPGESK